MDSKRLPIDAETYVNIETPEWLPDKAIRCKRGFDAQTARLEMPDKERTRHGTCTRID